MILGLDIGSVSVKLAGIDQEQKIVYTDYTEHAGDIRSTLQKLLAKIPASEIQAAAAAASSAVLDPGIPVFDSTVCIINGVRAFYPNTRSILHAGGQRFFLAELGEDGTYRRSKGSSSCAAGTGSFLDQQARRLGLPGSFRIAELAAGNTGNRPVIASRCAVFAKTDLIHAQQEGYTIEEICDGLCFGLARNMADTVLTGEKAAAPLVMSGGVAMNSRVVEYSGKLLGTEPIVSDYAPFYGAVGACFELLNTGEAGKQENRIVHIIREESGDRSTYYFPLRADLPGYPDFSSGEIYREPGIEEPENGVEVEIFALPGETRGRIGFDIGSTSTKAVVTEKGGRVLFGFYTRTAGRPLTAVRSILRSAERLLEKKEIPFRITQAAATGSGRKFAGVVIGADLIVDEITAHARAAYNLNPETDTIIEIGGQDAKFTTMTNGSVTFSQMNAVCAAGTGSFIEEQAAALNVPLSEYASLADNAPSPMASDRCTVFMERDIKQFLNTGYPVPQLLAAVLHSVRENYLQKVAVPGEIGEHICFQGATGKNRALVAAFAQKLGKPLYVSRYCHLTGALGAALILEEENPGAESFRGIGIYKKNIEVRSERCGFCRNHCRIRIARVGDDEVAYGFLCGRDYETKKYVPKEKRSYDLIGERRKLLENAIREHRPEFGIREGLPVIGIPASLHLTDDLPVWETFFRRLGFPVVTSTGFDAGIHLGRKVSGSEFCSPMTELHGHVMHLLDRADYVFVPEYFQQPVHSSGIKNIPEKNRNFKPGSFFCYYTQYASVLMEEIAGGKYRGKILRPLIGYLNYGEQGIIKQLSKMISEIAPGMIPPEESAGAYREAVELDSRYRFKLREFGENIISNKNDDISIVITGRPYTVLSPETNKNIPEIISALGLHPVFQDMMNESPSSAILDSSEMLSLIPWSFAYQIIKTAYRAAVTPGLYPIFVTSFKCSPDSFITEYFKRIMERAGKPYLILQVDDHDSSVGYETRIEAGIRAFRNHIREAGTTEKSKNTVNVVPKLSSSMNGKTLLIPNWDPITNPLLAANLRETAGIDACVLSETGELISRGMRHNTGQCIPANVIVEEVINEIEKQGLVPDETVLWIPRSGLVCNFAMYPAFIKSLLESQGEQYGNTGVFAGDFTFVDVSFRTTVNAYFAYLFGGLLRRIGCMMRPYEIVPGSVDAAIEESVAELIQAFQGKIKKIQAVKNTVNRLEGTAVLPVEERPYRPKAAIFGDLYIRDNEIINQNLIKTIEAAGGEVVTTPYSDYVKIIASAYFKKLRKRKHYKELVIYRNMLRAINLLERIYYRHFSRFEVSPAPHRNPYLRKEIGSFGLRIEHTGESFENALKIFHILKAHPDISLFVQVSPAFCCPSMVTEAMAPRIEEVTGVPVVSVNYDGTGSPVNDAVVPYIAAAKERAMKDRIGAEF